MARLQIIVAGETVYDEDVTDERLMPPRPEQIPAAVKAQLDPNAKLAPWMKLALLHMVGHAMQTQLERPQLAPLDVKLDTWATGINLRAEMPPLSPDVALDHP